MCFCAVAWIRRAPLRALFFMAVEQPARSQCTELRNRALDVNKPLWLSTRLNLQQEWTFNLFIARGKSVCIDNEMSDSYEICFVKRLLQFSESLQTSENSRKDELMDLQHAIWEVPRRQGTVPSHTAVHRVYLQLNRLQLTPGCYNLTTHTPVQTDRLALIWYSVGYAGKVGRPCCQVLVPVISVVRNISGILNEVFRVLVFWQKQIFWLFVCSNFWVENPCITH